MHRGIKLGLYGLVLAGLLGGTAAWANEGKSVSLQIDGQSQKVHTTASSVEGVLKAAHVSVGPHDLVAPDLASHVGNGAQIVVSRGHLLHLSVNGVARDVWVNADTVEQALAQLGFGDSAGVSVSRSKRLDASATDIAVSSPKHITIRTDGMVFQVASPGPTVQRAIADSGLYFGPHDKLSVPLTSTIRDGEVITINRVAYGSATQQVSVPFGVTKQSDPNSLVGTESTVSPGHNGTSRVTYQLVYVDGVLTARVPVASVVVAAPVNQVDKVGTQQPSVTPANQAQAIAEQMVAARGWGSDQFSCLVSLWNKESGWRTDAANPSGAYGIPQALPGSKMASAGPNWQTDAATQITWGLNYISGVYGTPCAAWAHSQATNWY
ncbi:MAG TPA: ubiquitin-like domain-containing protein [Jatrophihabitans sp.]|nr:ubiquitin-like domain-containing protein [Jatrophihabitans sp.]